MGAVRRARIDHPNGGVFDGRYRVACGLVGQAENRDVAVVDGFGATLRILAMFRAEGEKPQIAALAQTLMDLQPGGALVAIDEYKGTCHGMLSDIGNQEPNLQRGSKIGKVEFINDEIQFF